MRWLKRIHCYSNVRKEPVYHTFISEYTSLLFIIKHIETSAYFCQLHSKGDVWMSLCPEVRANIVSTSIYDTAMKWFTGGPPSENAGLIELAANGHPNYWPKSESLLFILNIHSRDIHYHNHAMMYFCSVSMHLCIKTMFYFIVYKCTI